MLEGSKEEAPQGSGAPTGSEVGASGGRAGLYLPPLFKLHALSLIYYR